MRGIRRRTFLAGTALAGFMRPALAAGTVPFTNWSGAISVTPRARLAPRDEAELVSMLTKRTGPVRVVGSGHSFSPIVPTGGDLVALDWMTGLMDHDPGAMTATFQAGTRLSDTGPALDAVGQAMINLPDIDRQTFAGAISTATHGTGIDLGGLSAYVTGLRLVTVGGDILSLSADSDADLFNAARVSVGTLGVISAITTRNREPYRLRAVTEVVPIEDALATFDEKARRYRHYELFPFLYSDHTMALSIEETDEPVNHPPPDPEADAQFEELMRMLMSTPAVARKPIIDTVVGDLETSVVVDASWRVLANIRNTRFNEMEYTVPAEVGADCLREILATVRDRGIDCVFPLEYRYVKGDDTWLGMQSGDGVYATISIHQLAGVDYAPYFDAIEPIFLRYGGRPHWGKLHSLDATQLAELYPRFEDFRRLRRELDPAGRLLNEHLKELFA